MTKLTQHEVKVLKMWSKEGLSAKQDEERTGRPAMTSRGLHIPQGNYNGRTARAFESLAELGLLKPLDAPLLVNSYKLTDYGIAEIGQRWPMEDSQ